MTRQLDQLLERAASQLQYNDTYGAIESLRQALTLDADHAYAHALLSVCLQNQKRLHAAEYEARAALALDPDLPFAHYAMGMAAMGHRRFKLAEEHLRMALGQDPTESLWLRSLAHLYTLWNKPAVVMPLLEKARELDPDDADNWAALAEHHRSSRNFNEAERHARQALEIDPENAEALVTMGYLLLERGETDEARGHALSVLFNDATHSGALHLLGAVKARQSLVLGLWWRFNSFISVGSMTRRVVWLIAFFLIYRIVSLVVRDVGYPEAVTPIQFVWLAFCVYTWVGPSLFVKQLQRELRPARLDSKY